MFSSIDEVRTIFSPWVSEHCGFDERAQLNTVKRFFDSVTVIETPTFGLFDAQTLPFNIKEMPDVFSPFRRKVEKHCKPLSVHPPMESLPSPFTPQLDESFLFATDTDLPSPSQSSFVEGETAALTHLNTYLFDWKAAATYKDTRNALVYLARQYQAFGLVSERVAVCTGSHSASSTV